MKHALIGLAAMFAATTAFAEAVKPTDVVFADGAVEGAVELTRDVDRRGGLRAALADDQIAGRLLAASLGLPRGLPRHLLRLLLRFSLSHVDWVSPRGGKKVCTARAVRRRSVLGKSFSRDARKRMAMAMGGVNGPIGRNSGFFG